jgi:hypothetical protein
MIDPKRHRYQDEAEGLRRELAAAREQLAATRAELRGWRRAYFSHMTEEHPEVVERVMRRLAKGEE